MVMEGLSYGTDLEDGRTVNDWYRLEQWKLVLLHFQCLQKSRMLDTRTGLKITKLNRIIFKKCVVIFLRGNKEAVCSVRVP